MIAKRLPIEPATVERAIHDLASHGKHGETGVWRQVYSTPWQAAQDALAAEFERAGLDVERDAAGNVWGFLAGTDGGKAIVTGSHVDSQCPGGRFDGALGIIAGLLAVKALKQHYGAPRRPLAVVSLAEEEASRFPAANFWGSRAIIGRVAAGEADTLLDLDGITMAPPVDARRVPIVTYPDWEQQVSVESVYENNLAQTRADTTAEPAARVTVTVRHNDRMVYRMSWIAAATQ